MSHTVSVPPSRGRSPLRTALSTLVGLLLTGLLVAGAPAPASAGIYAGGGDFGPYVIYQIPCRFKTFGTTVSLVSEPPPPWALARNLRAGRNNDAAWVRYQVYLVNTQTGATVMTSGWSGWAYATDVSPATWSGSTTMSHSANGPAHVVDYRIEFSSSTGTGWAADRATSYQYYDRWNRGPFSATTC